MKSNFKNKVINFEKKIKSIIKLTIMRDTFVPIKRKFNKVVTIYVVTYLLFFKKCYIIFFLYF